jgi:hypothetical protein
MSKIKELSTILTDKDTWIKCRLVANKNDDYAECNSPEAVKFCIMGALLHLYKNKANNTEYNEDVNKLNEYARVAGYVNVVDLNNDSKTTFADIQNLISDLS